MKTKKYDTGMSSKQIRDYLPGKTTSTAFTTRVPAALLKEVKDICAKEGLSFTDVVKACLTKFVDEMSNKRKSA
jgi:hypothetical protein